MATKPKVGQIAATKPRFEYVDVDRSQLTGARFYDDSPVVAEAEAPEAPGMLRRIGDTAVQFGQGAVTGVKMMSDIFGANNAVSSGLSDVNQALDGLLSATAQNDKQKIAQIMQEAEGKGWGDQIIAGLKAAGVDPVGLAANALGTSLPTMATMLIPGAGPAAVATRMGAGVAMGAGQGVGAVKGQIYDETKRKWLETGAAPEQAEAKAQEAAAYGGANTDQMAIGGVLGMGSVLGAERALGKVLHGASKAGPGMLGRVATSTLAETGTEMLQGGQEKFATNTALNRQGFDVDPMSGVIANATLEGAAAAPMGAVAGIPKPAVATAPGIDPAKEAADTIRATETVPESGPMTRASNAATEAKAQAIEAGAPLVDEQATAEPMPEPVDDPVRDQILALPDGARQDALRAYAVVNRTDVAKGVQQYNRKLLDRLLTENAPPPVLGERLTDTDMGAMLGGGGLAGNADPLMGALGMGRDAQANSITNVANVAERRPPMPASDAARMLDEARNRGLDFAVAEHPAGGFVLVPPNWVTPDMAAQGEARLNETIARMQQADAAPVERAQRTSTAPVDLSLPTDPVENFVGNLRTVNTPAARAYVRDFDAGRITPADVQRRMVVEQGKTPDQRIAQAAAEAPAQADPVADRLARAAAQGAAVPAPTDILNPVGLPFKTRMAADRAAKQTPGAVVPVEGGFVVRPQEPVNVQDVPQAPEVPQAAPAISQPGQAPQAVGAQPAGPAAGVPAEGAGAVEAAGLSDQLEDALIKERDATTSAIENDWMDGNGRRRQTNIERAVHDAVTASTLDADSAAQIIETALENDRPDLAQYAASRAMRAAESMGTTPGVPQSSPKYGKIKSDLEASKKQALDAASALQEIVNSKQAPQAVAGVGGATPTATPGATPIVEVQDNYGRTHRVRQSDLYSNADRIPTVRKNGEVVAGEEIPRSIVKDAPTIPLAQQGAFDGGRRLEADAGDDAKAAGAVPTPGDPAAGEPAATGAGGDMLDALDGRPGATGAPAGDVAGPTAPAVDAPLDALQNQAAAPVAQAREATKGVAETPKPLFSDPRTGMPIVVPNKATADAMARSKQLAGKAVVRKATPAELADQRNTFAGYNPGEDRRMGYVLELPQQDAPPAQETIYNGTRIYPTKIKVGDEVKSMWAAESPDNQRRRAAGERAIGGDSLHDTIEQAKAAAEREAKRDAEQRAAKEEQDAADKARLDAEEARKAVNRPKTVVERRKDAILDGPSKIGPGTKRAVITSAVDNGYAIEAKMVYDSAAKKRDQEAVDRASRAGYILGVSNENLPLVKAGNEAKARLKEGKYEKPEYRVYQGSDTKGPFREITKTEYDYAQELKAQRAAAPQAAESPTLQTAMGDAGWAGETGQGDTIWTKRANGERYTALLSPDAGSMEVTVLVGAVDTQIASFKVGDAKAAAEAANKAVAQDVAEQSPADDFLPEGWTKSVNGYTKRPMYRMEQGGGQPFAVVTQVEGMQYEVQIRHGDKQLTVSTQRGALSEVLAKAETELTRMTQADSVTHQDPGEKAEAATPGVVTDSLKKAARNEDTKPSEMRKWLVAEIDKELLQAADRMDYDEAVKRLGEKDAISGYTGNGPLGKNSETGYITFDVPGDGKYKVRNSVRGLLEFRKNVMASQGFKDGGQKRAKPEQNDGVQGGSGGNMTAITNMIEEGDFEAARDYAEAVGVSLDDVKVPKGDRQAEWSTFRKTGALPPDPFAPSKDWVVTTEPTVAGMRDRVARLTRVAGGAEYIAIVRGGIDGSGANYKITKDGKQHSALTSRVPFSEALKMAEGSMPAASSEAPQTTGGKKQQAKKLAEEVGMAKAVADGFVEEGAEAPKSTEKPAAPATTSAPIEDAGEKIGGARKDRWKERGLNLDDLDAMTEAEGAELATKANVWKPDYEVLSDASEPASAAMTKVIYDRLAAKPKKNTPEGRRQYVRMMRIVRDVLTEAKGPEAVRLAYLEIRNRAGLNTMDPQAKTAARELLFSVYKGRSDPFVLDGGDLMKVKKMVTDGFPAKGEPWKTRLKVGRQEGGPGATERGIELYIERSAEVGTPLTREQILDGFYRVTTKDNKTVAFAPTKADADAAAATVYERDMKGKKDGKPEPVRPNLDELKRENLPQRIDRDVTSEDFVRDMGFRGVEFGLWSAQDERQRILNMAYDGLMDLAEIMGVPPKAMSLNGTLGMAFGARGGGRFAAHYEPGKLVINMTKIRGGGSMAHEWAHAMDHYFGELDKADAYTTAARGASGWYSEDQYLGVPRTRHERVGNEWKAVNKMRLDNLRPEMAAAFDEVMRALFSKQITKAEMVRSLELDLERTEALARSEQVADLKAMYQNMVQNKRQALNELRGDPEGTMYAGRGRTDYANQAQALSGKSENGYWTRPTEMFARAFESWVFDRVTAMGAKSDYLVHGVEEDRFAGGAYKGNPYPAGEERASINAAFDKLASTIKTKETDKGVAMFSRTGAKSPNAQQPTTRAWYDRFVSLLPASYRNDSHRREPLPAEDWNVQRSAEVREKIDVLNKQLRGANDRKGYGPVSADGLGNLQVDARSVSAADLSGPIRALADELGAGVAATNVRHGDVQSLLDAGFVSEISLAAIADRVMGRPFVSPANSYSKDFAPGTILTYKPRGFPAVLFARNAAATTDSDARNVATQLLVDGLKAKWTRAPEIIVARNMQDRQIPQAVRDYDQTLKSQGATGEARGFIYKGKVYLLSDQLKGPQQIAEVLFHEVLGHYGLRGAFGIGLDSILQQIGTMRRKEVVAKAREYGLFDSDALGGLDKKTASDAQIWAAMSAKQRLDAAEEVLAEMAQTKPELGFVKRAIAAIRNWLRANVPGFQGMRLTDADIVQAYILPARGYVTRSNETAQQAIDRAMMAFSRGKNESMTNNDVVGNTQGGRSADDTTPGAAKRIIDAGIEFVSQIESLAEKHGRVYIRWSPSASGDLSGKQASRDFVSGETHSGLSAIEITGDMHPVDIAFRLSEYGFLRLQDRRSTPHVFLAEKVGVDSDGYESIKPTMLLLDSDADVVNAIDSKLADIMDSMDNIERESERLKKSPGHPAVVKRLNAAKAKLLRLLPNEPTAPDSGGAAYMGTKDQTETPAFRKWFGDSKAVDADGKPLVVYHGTGADISVFDAGKIGSTWGADTEGFFFTSDAREASGYAESNGPTMQRHEGGNVMPVYLSIQRPVTIQALEEFTGETDLSERFDDPINLFDEMRDDIQVMLLGNVQDGWYIDKDSKPSKTNSHDGVLFEVGGKILAVAVDPTQIKSATGNNGQFDPANPDIRFSRAAVAGMASKAGEAIKSVTVTNVKQRAGFKLTDYLGIGLQALGRRQIVDIYGDLLPLTEYNRLVQQMEADKNEGGAEADQLVTRWAKLDDESKLADLMHDATLAQIDPDKPFADGDDKGKFLMLERKFKLLSDEAKAVYRDTRDAYKAHHSQVRSAIKERIERSEIKGERKAALLKQMDDEFFAAVKGVYFPLARFGQYAVTVKGPDGKVESVSRAETKAEAEALRNNLLSAFPRDKGFTVGRVMLSKDFIADRDAVGRGFMTELYQVLDKQDMDAVQRAELEDTLGQLYLSSLPDLSWAKHGIHRKGTPGFSQDARRAFAQNMFHGARYLAKLRYSDLMQDELSSMQKHVDDWREVEDFDQNSAQRVVDEMNKRHESLMNPKSNALSTALTSLGFVFHLGLSPASAMVNLSQTALVAYPIMGAKWGFGKASAALLKASAEAAKGKNDITGSLNADERAAYDEAVRAGTIDVTMAHDLAGIAQGEDAGVMWKIRPVMRWASFMFHHAERFNRQVTFVAAYRLAREAGADNKAAFEQATKATYDGHFDYGACVDDATEILTTTGWKKRADLQVGDVAIATDASGRAVHSKVLAVNVYEGDREVIEFKSSNRFSMVLTPNHDAVIQNYSSRDKKWQGVRKVRADSLKNHHFILRTPLAPLDEQGGIYGEDFASLLGWIAAEGWYSKYRKTTAATDVRIGQSVTHNPEYVAEIRGILERLGGEFKEYTYERSRDVLTTFVLRRSLGRRIQECLPEKVLTPDLVASMSTSEMRAFLMAFLKGDGTQYETGRAWAVGQKNGANLDLLQAMATMCGMRATLSPINSDGMAHLYVVPDDTGARSHVRPLEQIRRVEPLVWCPTTEHGTWIARRNGAVFVTGNSNRPRIMQGNVAKVLLLFKQYGQNMVYTLARNAQQAIKGESPEVRAQARKALGGLLATHAAAAGVLGLPMVTTLLAAASMIGGDDDEPWDAKVALQNMLADALGQKPAEVLAHGLSRLTPWDISGRVGLDKLIFPDVQEGLEGQRLGEAAMAAALGPVAGIGINVLKGLQDMSQGQYARGLESMMPAALRSPIKAIRYEAEGVQDKTGVVIQDEVSLAGVAGQFLGFSPSEVRNATEGKSAIYQQDRALGERRQELLTKAARATMAKDAEARAEAMKEIQRFNEKNPTRRITPLNVLQSVRNRNKRIDQSEGGIYLPKNRRDAMDAGRFAVSE
jgi:hypothetical protein